MDTLLCALGVGVFLSAVRGLGRLSNDQPIFASKLLPGLFVIVLMLQVCFKVNTSVWVDNESFIENSISKTFSSLDSVQENDHSKTSRLRIDQYALLEKEREKVKAAINLTLSNASKKMEGLKDTCDYIFYLTYGILGVQFMLCRFLPKSK
jgi:hypothetical protein